MKLLNLPRQSGKTTKIIEEMKKNKSSLMIVPCKMQAMNIIKNNRELDGRVLTLEEYQTHEGLRSYNMVHIDDLDIILRIGHKIGLMTMCNFPGGFGE